MIDDKIKYITIHFMDSKSFPEQFDPIDFSKLTPYTLSIGKKFESSLSLSMIFNIISNELKELYKRNEACLESIKGLKTKYGIVGNGLLIEEYEHIELKKDYFLISTKRSFICYNIKENEVITAAYS